MPPRTPQEAPEPDAAPTLYVVVSGFYAEPLPYVTGEVIHPDDPYLKANPERFRPFKFPHPVKRRGLASPQIRAGA